METKSGESLELKTTGNQMWLKWNQFFKPIITLENWLNHETFSVVGSKHFFLVSLQQQYYGVWNPIREELCSSQHISRAPSKHLLPGAWREDLCFLEAAATYAFHPSGLMGKLSTRGWLLYPDPERGLSSSGAQHENFHRCLKPL